MKKTILTIAIALSAVLGISKTGFAATGSSEDATTLTEVSQISKIEIHGNVQVYLSNGTADQVKVYNHYYSESALVQDQDGLLRITSYSAKKLVVWVTVSDLHKLSVYDNAVVKSFGKLSAIDLDVKLYNTALVQLNLDSYSANVGLHDGAKADLTGNITTGRFAYDQSSFLNTAELTVTGTVKKVRYTVRNFSSDLASL